MMSRVVLFLGTDRGRDGGAGSDSGGHFVPNDPKVETHSIGLLLNAAEPHDRGMCVRYGMVWRT